MKVWWPDKTKNELFMWNGIEHSTIDSWGIWSGEKGFQEGDLNLCSNNLSSTTNYQCGNSSHLEKYRLNICDSNSKSNFQEIVNGIVDGMVDSITEYIGVFAKKKIHISPCEIK
jgi:hypothetical protein